MDPYLLAQQNPADLISATPVGVRHDLAWTAVVLVAYLLVRRFVVERLSLRFDEAGSRYAFRKTGNTILSLVLMVALLVIWLRDRGVELNVLQFAGLLSAGLAIALQDPITNLAGWLFIVLREPFRLQDRIQIGDGVRGDVIDIRIFSFSMLEIGNWVDADQSTGRIIHVPNGQVFKQPVANYTQGFNYVWNEIPVTVTFESDWRRAHEVLTRIVTDLTSEAVEEASREVRETSKFMVHYRRFTPIVWVRVADSGVTLTLRYLCAVRARRSSETEIWKAVLDAFATEGSIDFAYPTRRFYQNALEGKPGAGGPVAGEEPTGA